jgi:hypothetical protein
MTWEQVIFMAFVVLTLCIVPAIVFACLCWRASKKSEA